MTKDKASGEGDDVPLATEESNIELRFSWEEESVAEARIRKECRGFTQNSSGAQVVNYE